jgi:hypothetical protein
MLVPPVDEMPRAGIGWLCGTLGAGPSRDLPRGFRRDERVTPHDGTALEHHHSVLVGDARRERRHGLVPPYVADGGLRGDHVTGSHRGEEPPRHLEEDAPGPRKLLRDQRVEQPGGDAALHDDPAEAGPSGEGVVVVEGVPVAGQLREQLDVAVPDGAGSSG